jgi:hypothetical protein
MRLRWYQRVRELAEGRGLRRSAARGNSRGVKRRLDSQSHPTRPVNETRFGSPLALGLSKPIDRGLTHERRRLTPRACLG